ncbi:MAG: hypothetical protein KatS3mg110_3815 [Pirellulaceae bacterium]|nr:MAG: hypothetical protein KatS3mg110_3815 [Pirellulaceae bacterium]
MPSDLDEGAAAKFHLKLDSETVAEVISADPVCVSEQATLREVLSLLRRLGRGCALVCQEQKLVGIFTERDALRLLALLGAGNVQLLDQPIRSLMVPNPVTIRKDATVAEAIRRMSQGGYRRLPVVDGNGTPVGVMKVSGILHYFAEHFPKYVYTLPPEPHYAPRERDGA